MIWYQSLVIDMSLYFNVICDFSIHLMQLTSNAHNFFICERKHQVLVCIFFLERDKYFDTKIIWVC